jgi:hypothetical protein
LVELHQAFEGYPKEIMEFNFEENFGVFLNNAIWDIKKGLIIKINADKEVTHALSGFEPLSYPEIKNMYGNPPKIKYIYLPDKASQMEQEYGSYMTMCGFLESFKVPIICQIIDLIKLG